MPSRQARQSALLHLARGRWPAGFSAQLAAAGGELAADPTAESLTVVLAERSDDRPTAPGAGQPWVWLTPGPATPAAIAAAAAAGAIDAIDASGPPAAVADRLVSRARELRLPAEPPAPAPDLVADSPAGRRLLAELHHAARTSMPVLLTGETGTGKEVAARLLHLWSSRRGRQFVPINCAAIPNEMLEAELFGYARGAFSGAVAAYEGQLSAAEGGTVFLDEVDDTPLSFQVKLLRVLEDRVVSRLGDNTWRKVDFRIVAATNRELRELIARKQFGPDLYERLAIVSIRVPPLRDRREDLPALCRLLISRFYRDEPEARGRHQVEEVTPEAMALLAAYDWPGNIRELRNVLYGALVRKRGGRQLLISDLSPRLIRPRRRAADGEAAALVDPRAIATEMDAGTFNLRTTLETIEREALRLALDRTAGNATAAASLLGEVGRGAARDPGATVRAMIRRLGLAREGRR